MAKFRKVIIYYIDWNNEVEEKDVALEFERARYGNRCITIFEGDITVEEIDLGEVEPDGHHLNLWETNKAAEFESMQKEGKGVTKILNPQPPQTMGNYKIPIIYSMPAHISKILDGLEDTKKLNYELTAEAIRWIKGSDSYLEYMGRQSLVLAYLNPLTSPTALPELWKIEESE